MSRLYTQSEIFYPFFLEPNDSISSVSMLIIRDDGYYWDFFDSSFKNSGWTTKERALTEKSEGAWVYATGWTTPNGARTYRVYYKDNSGFIYEGPEIQVVTAQFSLTEISGSEVEIVNLALSHIGVGKEVANLETEDSEEANTARRYYGTARDTTLRDFPWPFATTITTLALVAEDPNDEWAYSYRYPSDCLYLRRILSGIRNDNRQTRVPYKIAQDTSGLLIFTDTEDAQVEYTIRATDPLRYPADFTMALSYYLAFLMAPRLTGGDQFKLGDRSLKLYSFEISRAVSRAFNEEQSEESPESEFIKGR